ncbi:MAG: GDSL-type esterase/lipase family protein [Desulfuromonadales bacterium]
MERALRLSPPPGGLVAFYGSSSMRMWESLEDDFHDVGVLNLAFGGSTLEACAWFFERLVVPCNPRSIVCYAGDNDLGDGRTPEEVLMSFRKLLIKIDMYCHTIPFTMLSIKPSPARWHLADQITFTNDTIRQELRGHDHRYFIDIFSAMLGSDGRPDDSLFLNDGLHVSPKGYMVWKELLRSRSGDIY